MQFNGCCFFLILFYLCSLCFALFFLFPSLTLFSWHSPHSPVWNHEWFNMHWKFKPKEHCTMKQTNSSLLFFFSYAIYLLPLSFRLFCSALLCRSLFLFTLFIIDCKGNYIANNAIPLNILLTNSVWPLMIFYASVCLYSYIKRPIYCLLYSCFFFSCFIFVTSIIKVWSRSTIPYGNISSRREWILHNLSIRDHASQRSSWFDMIHNRYMCISQ